MSYLKRRLGADESIVHEGAFHWLDHAGLWALVLLGLASIVIVPIYAGNPFAWTVCVIFAPIFLIWAAFRAIRIMTTEMAVTNRRVLLKKGWLNVDLDSLMLEAVESVKIRKTLPGRILRYGRIIISGRGELHIDYPSMAYPSAFAAALEEVRGKARDKGTAPEPPAP